MQVFKWYKHSHDVVCVSKMIHAMGYWELRQRTNILNVCSMLCEVTDQWKNIQEIPAEVGISVGSIHRLEKWAQNNWFLLHDSAPGHWSLVVKKYLTKHNVTALEHLSHSLDLSLPDFVLFLWLTSVLKGRFASAKEVTANGMRTLTEVVEDSFWEEEQWMMFSGGPRWEVCKWKKLIGQQFTLSSLKFSLWRDNLLEWNRDVEYRISLP
jgi:hypothetical protein